MPSKKTYNLKSAKFGPIEIPVNISDKEAFNEYAISIGEPVYGAFDAINGIQVNPDLPPSKKKVILMHEILHAILDSLSVVLTDELEEQLVTDMAVLIVSLIQENPKLIGFICDGEQSR